MTRRHPNSWPVRVVQVMTPTLAWSLPLIDPTGQQGTANPIMPPTCAAKG